MEQVRSGRVGLSRQVVVDAAESLVDRHGFDALSLRQLAGSLGVTPMALYRHVGGIEDLVNELVERAVERADIPPPPEGDWPTVLEWFGRAFFGLLTAHPLALRAYLHQPVTTRQLRRLAEPVLTSLKEAGFSDDGAVRAYRAVMSVALGFASLREKWWSSGEPPLDRVRDVEDLIRSGAEVEGMETVAALAPGLASPYPLDHYDAALRSVVRGLDPASDSK